MFMPTWTKAVEFELQLIAVAGPGFVEILKLFDPAP
jgi:hypothetical protein